MDYSSGKYLKLSELISNDSELIYHVPTINSLTSGNDSSYVFQSSGVKIVDDNITGLTANLSCLTLTHNADDVSPSRSNIFYGVCTTPAGTAAKTVTINRYDHAVSVLPNIVSIGNILFITFSNTNSASVNDLTLSVNGGTPCGIRKIKNYAVSTLSNAGELIAGCTYMFTFDGDYWVCMTLDYNNTYSHVNGVNYLCYETKYLANASNPLYRYKLYGYNELGKVVPITITNQTNATIVSKTPTSLGIKASRGICYYGTTTNITNTSTAIGSCYSSYNMSNSVYTFNTNVPAYCDIYLKGTYDVATDLFYLDTSSNTAFYAYASRAAADTYTTYTQNFVAGYYYMFVGSSYSSANYFQLREHNPLYYFDGTNLTLATTNISPNGLSNKQYYLVGSTSENNSTLYRYKTNGPYMVGNQLYAGSDLAYKKDITPISNDFVNQLFEQTDITYDFTWKDSNSNSSGFIAQWIEDIMPEVVNGEDGEKHVNYDAALSKVVGAMFKKIQEQQNQIDELIKQNKEIKKELENIHNTSEK